MIIVRSFKTAFSDILNGIYPSICFTYEKESERRIAFLDVAIHKGADDTLKMMTEKKLCDTGQILHYKPGHPVEHKQAVVWTLFSCSIKITLEPTAK